MLKPYNELTRTGRIRAINRYGLSGEDSEAFSKRMSREGVLFQSYGIKEGEV